MNKKFNLSDKKVNFGIVEDEWCYLEKDVKEFIKRLKEEYLYLHEGNRHEKLMIDKIDKLAGERLI